MSSDPFFSFLALVTQDAHAVAAQKKITACQAEDAALLEALKHTEHAVSNARARAHTAKKNLDAQELETQILKERQRALARKLQDASSPKEYFSLETEQKTVTAQLDVQETRLFELFEAYELLEKEYAQADFELIKLREATQQQRAELQAQLMVQRAAYAAYRQSCKELEPHIQPEVLEKFISMKQSIENPVVPVKKGACSGCCTTLSTQELVSIRKHKLIACQQCYRLLYSVLQE